jgi:hypothetical protein
MIGAARPRSRWAVITAVAALVTAGLLVSAPAHAATASIGVTDPVVYTDSWSSGIDVIGGGFTPGSLVTLSIDWVRDRDGSKVHYGDMATPASASGLISVTGWVPAMGPDGWADATLTLSATSDAGDTSNAVAFDVRNPPGIDTNAPTLTTTQFMDPAVGLTVQASGFTPGEAVAFSAVYNGTNLPAPSTIVANKYGTVVWQYVRSGTATAGSVVIVAAGADSRWSTTVTITGATISGSTAPTSPIAPTTPAGPSAPAAPVQTTPRALPVVSG